MNSACKRCKTVMRNQAFRPFTSLLFYLFTSLLFISCQQASPEQRAAKAAKDYYDQLVEGYIEGFLEGKAHADSLPSDYMEQMVMVHRQYLSDLQRKHGGLQGVAISRNVARRDESLGVTCAFLLLTFADSTQEEVMVPMVEQDGTWRMK